MKIAILGATGLVGRTMLQLVADRPWVADAPLLLATARSAGTELPFRDGHLACQDAAATDFHGVDLVLASAGAGASREFSPRAVAAGTWVVDNSSAFRGDESVPLVVPEINGELLVDCRRNLSEGRGGIVANPNCSTIQIAMAVAPLQRAFGASEVQVTTLQSVSGAGQRGLDELRDQQRALAAAAATGGATAGNDGGHASVAEPDPAQPGPVSPRRIAGNAIPAIGGSDGDGWYEEETKVRRELRKILDLPDLRVTCTATRVPVLRGHAAACRMVCQREVSRSAALEVLAATPGVVVANDPAAFSTPAEIAGRTDVHVGRLRRDPDRADTLLFWVVADNLLKGAAWNAVQITELLATGSL